LALSQLRLGHKVDKDKPRTFQHSGRSQKRLFTNVVGKPESFRVTPTVFGISRTYQKRTLNKMAFGLQLFSGLRPEGSVSGCSSTKAKGSGLGGRIGLRKSLRLPGADKSGKRRANTQHGLKIMALAEPLPFIIKNFAIVLYLRTICIFAT
jgi:hypothetical protein